MKYKLNLKKFLKTVKLNESTVSMILGAVVIIVVGILVVNYFKGQDKSGKLTDNGASNNITNNENALVPGEKYTVSEGDNLWKIAQKAYGDGYKWTDIAKTNNLSDPSKLEIGQELDLPQVETKIATAESQVVEETISTKTNTNTISGATYVVVRGDNLWDISVRAYGDGYKWVEIARENKLVHPNLIHAGNNLVLPR